MTTSLVIDRSQFPPELIAEWEADGLLDDMVAAGFKDTNVRVLVQRRMFNPVHEKATGRFGKNITSSGSNADSPYVDASTENVELDAPITLTRGVQVPLTADERALVDRKFQPPMTEAEIDQHHDLGPVMVQKLLDYRNENVNGPEAEGSLGTHWTTDKHWASVAADRGGAQGGMPIVVQAQWRGKGFDPTHANAGGTGTWKAESETTLALNAELLVTGMWVGGRTEAWQNVIGEPILVSGGKIVPGKSSFADTVRVRSFFNPVHEKASGRFGVKVGGGGGDVLDGGDPEGADGIMVEKAIDDSIRAAELDPDIRDSITSQSQIDMHFQEDKAVTVYRLDQKLRDDPDWQALVKENANDQDIMSPRDGMQHMTQSQLMADSMVGAWAGSASDDNPMSLEMQHAANVEFGLKGTSAFPEASRKANPWEVLDSNAHIRPLSPQAQMGVRKFTRAQYDNTQESLRTYGIEKVKVYRGVHDLDIAPGGGRETFTLNPLSSWSTDFRSAGSFATPSNSAEHRTATVIGASIPRSRILSMPGSGIGCRNEHEVVVLGGKVKAYRQTRLTAPPKYSPYEGVKIAPTSGGISADGLSFDQAWKKGATTYSPLRSDTTYAERVVVKAHNIDEDLANADWAKATWDISAWDVESLRAWLVGQRVTVEHFVTLPVFALNVDKLPWLRELRTVTVRSFFNPRHDRRTGRFAVKPATTIGITPNRGKPKQTIAETEPYYGSSRYKNFRHHAEDDVPKGVTLLSNEKVSGFWEGGLEPSAQIVVKGGRPAAVKAYATGIGKRFNQDGVVAFTPREGGTQRLYRWKVADANAAVAALRSTNVMGASIHGGRVEVIDLYGSEHGKMIDLGKALGHKGQVVRGDGVLWEKGIAYASAIMSVMVTDTRAFFNA